MISEPSEPVRWSENEDVPPVPERPGRWRRIRAGLGRFGRRLLPGEPTRRGAGRGALIAAIVLSVVAGATLRIGLGPFLDVLVGAVAGLLLGALVGLGAVATVKLVHSIPRLVGWLGLGALGMLVFVFLGGFEMPPPLALILGVGLFVLHALLGGALASLRETERSRRAKRAALATLAVLVLAADVYLIWWLADRGTTEHLVKVKGTEARIAPGIAPLAAADPSRPGPFKVLTLTYGSGTDRRRPEFGAKATLRTPTVDATPFVTGNDEGWRLDVRKWFWGFDFKKFPINGRVWYPDGPGPFPLALIVHGNHTMVEFSDPGYAYLGELLASRGFITVSVDENFFNGYWSTGVKKENDGRGWMLLKHLEVWRNWNRTSGHRFQGMVDLDNIALIGHSRGGEAAGIAASFNRLRRYPDDATVKLGFGFGIRAVVAIAPSDGQYKPAGQPTPVSGVNYLLLHAGHDSDVSIFMGERLYRRLKLPEDRYAFKAILSSYRSNHGQFNTVWGDADVGWPQSLLLNREALLAGEEQRQIGKLFISAFLEATLHRDPAYVRLFRDPRSAAAWMPDDLYVSRFQDSTFHKLADYEEDVDVTSASRAGAAIDGRGFTLWKEADLPYRQGEGTKENQVAYLGWKRKPGKAPASPASYAVNLSPGLAAAWSLGPGSLLTFSLADTGDEAPDPKDEEKGEKKESEAEKKGKEQEKEREKKEKEARREREKKEGREPLDLTVELVSANGAVARLPLSRFRAVPVPAAPRFTKLRDEEDLFGKPVEPILQTFELPLEAFTRAAPGFDPAALRTVRLVFDRSPEGVVILDDVGFSEGRERVPGAALGPIPARLEGSPSPSTPEDLSAP